MKRPVRVPNHRRRKTAWPPQGRGPGRLPFPPLRAQQCADSYSAAELQPLIVGGPDRRVKERGAVAIEFAFLAPALILLLLGAVEFGILLKNYVTLTNAVSVGAMQFAISRSDTTPYTDTVSAIEAAAPTLTPASLTITLSVSGTACATNSACSTALASAAPSGGTIHTAAVTATYPCASGLLFYNFWSSTCNLTSTMAEGVQ